MVNNYLGLRSLRGLWVGDCIGNSCQLYNIHDVLRALKGKLGDVHAWLPNSSQFKYSDDTEEAIVLFNHLVNQGDSFDPKCPIDLDKLAMEFATRYMERDPDGETFGYGLMTRKVLRDIYEGVPWPDANKTYKVSEGMSSHVDDLVTSILDKKSWQETAKNIKDKIALEKEITRPKNEVKTGPCGNGAIMRVSPLGALLRDYSAYEVARAASLSALPTHDHPEAIAAAMAVSGLSWKIAKKDCRNHSQYWEHVLSTTPEGDVYKGLMKASMLDMDAQLGVAIQLLGNGSHVTCQDTAPLCCWLTIRGLSLEHSFEKIIEDTSACGGDVDTTCAIVGGMTGILLDPPDDWINLCVPMEGVNHEALA